MKEKILAALRLKYPGMPGELLGSIADKMALTITTDDQIQGGITELEKAPISIADYAAILQKEGDRRVSEGTRTHEAKLREKFEFKEKVTPPGEPKPGEPKPGEGDAEIKAQLASVLQKLATLESKEAKQGLQDQFAKKLAEKKIPASFARGRLIESADQIDKMLIEAEAEYTEVKQGLVNQGLGGLPIPIGGEGRTDNIDADIKAWGAVPEKKTV